MQSAGYLGRQREGESRLRDESRLPALGSGFSAVNRPNLRSPGREPGELHASPDAKRYRSPGTEPPASRMLPLRRRRRRQPVLSGKASLGGRKCARGQVSLRARACSGRSAFWHLVISLLSWLPEVGGFQLLVGTARQRGERTQGAPLF